MEDASINLTSAAEKESVQERSVTGVNSNEGVRKEAFVYRQDVISLKTKENIRGLVMEVAGEYDSDDSSSDDSEVDEEVQSGNKAEANAGTEGEVPGNVADDDDSLPDDQLRVTWTDGTETLENIDNVVVVDRSFIHGDLVASASDPSGQLGQIMDVNIMVDLQASNGEIIKGVSSRDLKHIRDFTIGDFVVYGPWLGRVDEVMDTVTVLFDDGSICKVSRADPLRLKPVKSMMDDTNSPYYPGQRVKAVSSSVFKSSRWLNGLWKANRLEGTVCKVETVSVVVYWIASAYFNSNQEPVPPEEVHPKYLLPLSCFSHSNWQLADWCFYPSLPQQLSSSDGPLIRDGDTKECPYDYVEGNEGLSVEAALNVAESSMDVQKQRAGGEHVDADNKEFNQGSSSISKEQAHENMPTYRKKLKKIFFKKEKRTKRRDDTFERALFITNTTTTVDVAWQDGRKQYGVSSTSLVPIHSPNDYEFFPEQYVMDKVANDGDDSSQERRVGLVKNFNAKDRTVSVKWLKISSLPLEFKEFENEEIVSAYELDAHPDYDYCYGDVVVRLPPASCPSEATADKTTPVELDKEPISTDKEEIADQMHMDDSKMEQSVHDQPHSRFASMSWVGNIIGLENGHMEVKWGDGAVSKVGPHEIYVVGRDDDDNTLDGASDISDGASWETVDNNDSNDNLDVELSSDAAKESIPRNHPEDSVKTSNREENVTPRGGPLAVPLAAIGFVTRLASELFSRGKKQADASASQTADEAESEHPQEAEENGNGEESNTSVVGATEEHITETEENVADTLSSSERAKTALKVDSDRTEAFARFDVVPCPPDHHYIEGSAQSTGGKKWVKKVQQEWSVLEKNLPDNIYVRVFEDRMDLLRAVIIGTSGTPYQDGLFFFDLYLSPEYPQVPPSVYYHSGGLRVNPNLYVDGKVCLSLLNTWTGKGSEVWDPATSSILQVLVSIQGLVLNEKPYFNEAGYEKQVGTVEGEKNSVPYNENTYLLNLKSMLYLLRRSPLGFEDFVEGHFKRRGHFVLKACQAYSEGAVIGSLTDDASLTDSSQQHSCSVGFKLALTKLLPRIYSALEDVGAYCEQFSHLRAPEGMPER